MIDNKGQLVVALPQHQPKSFLYYILIYVIIPIAAPILITYKMITDKSYLSTTASLYSLVANATKNPCSTQWYFQNVTLLRKLWELPSAKAYIDKETNEPLVEYQIQEGYCGSATQRCILKSLGCSSVIIPQQKRGESKPDIWCEHICQIGQQLKMEVTTKIVRGDVTYEEFLSTLKRGLESKNCRIGCNFLRSALTGFEGNNSFWWLSPSFILTKVYAGHFSPVLGIVEQDGKEGEGKNPFVAIWDTNHKYNGAYFVPARRLYDAVSAVDVLSNLHRAIILVEKKETCN
uniref:Glutathione gamma-glutamylcysteinyltransferase n=1 Tax=Ditylum brightwellii TaxID=49249 RepID=A0A7S4R595_9STRA|mmetsp:Transcript_11938/g.15945  ORF Transcript_11938/g.15945 Transcript_11938/m.15945 type:complete len:290 (-) Transcript_11938:888-1757(-)